MVRNRERLVYKGYAKEEGLDYKDTITPIAILEGFGILLAFSTYKGFKVHHMVVKPTFLNVVKNST